MRTATQVEEISRPARWLDHLADPRAIFVLFFFSIIVINPFREILTADDSWAYARTVQHLLSTKRYQLDIWSAANMPTQIYLAAALSKSFGYSLSLLRCFTLVLLGIGLFSFYSLLREFSCPRKIASVCTLALLASPLTIVLGFTFMSDVPFLSWLLLALWLYVRGLRNNEIRSMLLGSLAAGCAVGTRQFGVTLVGGLLLCWLLSSRERRPPLRLIAAGLAAPLLTGLLQFHSGLAAPNITQTVRMAQQHEFFHLPIPVLIEEFFWRCAVIVQYTGMAMLPVLPLALFPSSSEAKAPLRGRWLLSTVLSGLAIIGALSMSSLFTARPSAQHRGVWEPLELYWLLPTQLEQHRLVMWLLDLGGIAGGAVLIGLLSKQIQQSWKSGRISVEWVFLAGTVAGFFALHLVYIQLNDTYILTFLPFALLAFAKEASRGMESRAALAASTALSAIFIVAISFYVRSEDAKLNAFCNAADNLVRSGVRPENIAGTRAWEEYHGAFDQWVAAGTPKITTPPGTLTRGADPFHDPFYNWMQERWNRADYRIDVYLRPPAGWVPVASYSYRTMFFHRRLVWVLKRAASGTNLKKGDR